MSRLDFSCWPVAVAIYLFTVSCTKNAPVVGVTDSTYGGRIQFLLKYNPNDYDAFYSVLLYQGLADSLAVKGPLTVFAPVRSCFTNSGNGADKDTSVVYYPMRRYILQQAFSLGQMKPGQTVRLSQPDGFAYYVRCYSVLGKTTWTVNGSLVTQPDIAATNGWMHQLSNMFCSCYFPNCLSVILADADLIKFSYALDRTGLTKLLLDTTQQLTVLAPADNAFSNSRWHNLTMDSIGRMPIDRLTRLLKYHIIPARMYSYDFMAPYSKDGKKNDTISLPTLAGENLKVVIPARFFKVQSPFSTQPGFLGSGDKYTGGYYSTWNPRYNPNINTFFDINTAGGVIHKLNDLIMPKE